MTDNEKRRFHWWKQRTLSLKGGAPGQQHITQTLARGQSRGVTIEVRKNAEQVHKTNSSGDEASKILTIIWPMMNVKSDCAHYKKLKKMTKNVVGRG